jgi:hypothetical protein
MDVAENNPRFLASTKTLPAVEPICRIEAIVIGVSFFWGAGMRSLNRFALGLAGLVLAAGCGVAMAESPVDASLKLENSGKNLHAAPPLDDMAFLRRVTVDLIGRIPTDAEIAAYMKLPAGQRRDLVIERLLKDERFADRWTVFFADMMRVRAGATGGDSLLAYLHDAVATGLPYDELARNLIAASGKVSNTPAVGFILGDDADPMALAGATAQIFMGVRIACAQCHDHPFDTWTQKQFYGLAAYFGKTKYVETKYGAPYTTEGDETLVLWPPERFKPKSRSAVAPAFPIAVDTSPTIPTYIARLTALRDAQARAHAEALARNPKAGSGLDALIDSAAPNPDKPAVPEIAAEARKDAQKLNIERDLYKPSALRAELGKLITDPRNRYFSQALVNRVWAEFMGRGFVMPLDDFKKDNPPSHPRTLDLLADDFVATGYDLRHLIGQIVRSEAYRAARLGPEVPADQRKLAEQNFAASPLRRMISEALFDSVVTAGHLGDFKWPAGANTKKIREVVEVPVPRKGTIAESKSLDADASAATSGKKPGGDMAMKGGSMTPAAPKRRGGYDLEQAIEVDYKTLLKPKSEIEIEAMEKTPSAEMMAMKEQGASMKYELRTIETTLDDNPRYTSTLRMPSPAPPAHFVRVFGQPARDQLGQFRDDSPSMRQALLMINGRVTHEASRVGPLEPVYKLLTGAKPDLAAAVRMTYREIFTREPAADELAEALSVIADAASPAEGLADLRWVMFNSHEFRYLP